MRRFLLTEIAAAAGPWPPSAPECRCCFSFWLAATQRTVGQVGSRPRVRRTQPAAALLGDRRLAACGSFRSSELSGVRIEHPLFLVLTMVAVAGPGIAAVAGDVETGRAELVYAAPVRRSAIYDARIVAAVLMGLAVTVSAVIGAEIGRALSPDLRPVSVRVPLLVGTQLLSLILFFIGVSFAASAGARSRATASGITVTIVAGSYLVNVVALLWWPLRWITNADAFHYFQPTEAAAHLQLLPLGILLVAGIGCALLGRVLVNVRDLA